MPPDPDNETVAMLQGLLGRQDRQAARIAELEAQVSQLRADVEAIMTALNRQAAAAEGVERILGPDDEPHPDDEPAGDEGDR
jgi:hypothetical protein